MMDRIQEIDQLIGELYNQLHAAVEHYVEESAAMMESAQPYSSIDSIVEKIVALKVERAYWANR